MEDETAETMMSRLDALMSRQACSDLVHEYARCIRVNTPDGIAQLFAPDGTFEVRQGHPDNDDFTVRSRVEGRDQVDGYLAQAHGEVHPIPLIHNLMVEVNGDTARSNCVMEAQLYRGKGGVFGDYADTFRRIDGRWYFASRVYTIYSAASSV